MTDFINRLLSRNAVVAGFLGLAVPWLADTFLPSVVAHGGWWAVGATVAIVVINALRAAVEGAK